MILGGLREPNPAPRQPSIMEAENPLGAESANSEAMMINDDDDEPYIEPVRGVVQPPVVPVTPGPSTRALRYLQDVANELWKHKHAWLFKEPVNAIKLKLPDYHTLIRRPMDLLTIRKRLDNNYYSSHQRCIKDFRLMFDNSYKYNVYDSETLAMTKQMDKIFQAKLEKLPTEADEEDLGIWQTDARRSTRQAKGKKRYAKLPFELPPHSEEVMPKYRKIATECGVTASKAGRDETDSALPNEGFPERIIGTNGILRLSMNLKLDPETQTWKNTTDLTGKVLPKPLTICDSGMVPGNVPPVSTEACPTEQVNLLSSDNQAGLFEKKKNKVASTVSSRIKEVRKLLPKEKEAELGRESEKVAPTVAVSTQGRYLLPTSNKTGLSEEKVAPKLASPWSEAAVAENIKLCENVNQSKKVDKSPEAEAEDVCDAARQKWSCLGKENPGKDSVVINPNVVGKAFRDFKLKATEKVSQKPGNGAGRNSKVDFGLRNDKMLKSFAKDPPKERVIAGSKSQSVLPSLLSSREGAWWTRNDNYQERLPMVTPERQQMRLLAQHQRRIDAQEIRNDNYSMDTRRGFESLKQYIY